MRKGGSKQKMKKRVSRSHGSGSDKPWQILFSLHPTLKGYGHHINSKGPFQSGFFEGRTPGRLSNANNLSPKPSYKTK